MTKPKMIAKTLKDILENPLMRAIMDRSHKINEIINIVMDQWKYDIYSRKPGVGYYVSEDGKTEIETDLDMACFLQALADRKAVINLPEYNARRPERVKEHQVSLSKENRHGQLLGITSNQNTFSFGVRFKDAQVINLLEDEQVGAYRTFLMTDLNGELYDGYNNIEFIPTYDENRWFYDHELWTDDPNIEGDTIHFKHFVQPSRWLSFYGQHYFIAKALEKRLVEQISYMNDLKQQILDKGIKYPYVDGSGEGWWRDTSHSYGHFKSERVLEFECEVDYPDDPSEYPTVEFNQDVLVALTKRVKKLNKILARMRYINRSTELAFASMHKDLDASSLTPKTFHLPAWIKNANWETSYRQKGKRKVWNRLKIVQPSVGHHSVAIRFRWTEKTEQVRQGRKDETD